MNLKNLTEQNAVKIFLNFYKVSYKDCDLRNSEEKDSVDVYFDKEKMEFQVTTVGGDVIRLLRDKEHSKNVSADEAINKIIVEPIKNKIEKYKAGLAIRNTILLIQTMSIPPKRWLKPGTSQCGERLNNLYKDSGFKGIYIVVDITNDVIPLLKAG